MRVYADKKDRVIPGTFTPYCSMSQAQLSFHGHRDAVKFFVSVPGGFSTCVRFNLVLTAIVSGHGGLSAPGEEGTSEARSKVESMLVMSGGEGYIDFRIGEHQEMSMVTPHVVTSVSCSHACRQSLSLNFS